MSEHNAWRGGLSVWGWVVWVLACPALAAAQDPSTQSGVWTLEDVQEYQAPVYNAPGSRFAQADVYCPAHTVEVGPGRDSRSLHFKETIPGDCHNRAGARGIAEFSHSWSEAPAQLAVGVIVPFELISRIVAVEHIGNGNIEITATVGFLPFDHQGEYPEPGSSGAGRDTRIVETALTGPAGTSQHRRSAPDADDPAAENGGLPPLPMPAHPWLGSERNDGRLRLRVHAWHGSGIFAAVDYIYRWVPQGAQSVPSTAVIDPGGH